MSRFQRTILLNCKADCDWLRKTHLKHVTTLPFDSFMLEGNDDAPLRVALFRDAMPAYNSKPIAMYVLGESGDLQLQAPVAPTKSGTRESVVFLQPTEKEAV